MSHEAWMRAAIAEGKAGAAKGNIGVGSVIVRDGRLVAGGHNEVLSGCDPTAHAEIVALRNGAKALGSPLLSGCTLYTTRRLQVARAVKLNQSTLSRSTTFP